MAPQEVLDQARVVLNDPGGSPRYTNAVLLPFFNDFLKSLASKRKDIFHSVENITLVAGEVQSVSRSQTNGLVDVLRNSDDLPVNKVTRAELEVQDPSWRKTVTTEKPFQWAWMTPGNEFDFILFPPAVAGDTLKAIVAEVPVDVVLADIANDIAWLSQNYRAPASAYVAGRALAINTSSVDVEKGLTLIRSGLDAI